MKLMKWVKYTFIGLVAISLSAVGGIYAASELRLAKSYDTAVAAFDAKAFAIPPAEAERRAVSMMCADCHQKAGQILFEADGVGRLVTPNLTRVAKTYTDGELERLIRKGVKRDGTAALIMPAKTYAYLADEDVAAVVTWLRNQKEEPDAVPGGTTFGPLGRLALATNQLPFEVDHLPKHAPVKMRPTDVGRYLVNVACLHCHQLKSEHDNGFGMKTPALAAMAQGYRYDQFATLLATGKPIGGREMPFMSKVSREAFAFYSAAEKRAIYDYLTAQ
jgi:mono/diheme cytochrome c family protein